MPDPTIHTARSCCSNQHWSKVVQGSYTAQWTRLPMISRVEYGWTCTCEAFRFQRVPLGIRTCQHIEAVRHERCGWNWEMEPGRQANLDDTCPDCGGETFVVKVGA